MLFLEELNKDMINLAREGAQVFSIGKTFLKRKIPCLKIGEGRPVVIVQYAIHAREFVTYYLALLHIRKLLREKRDGTVYFVPVANPDGVALCRDGLDTVHDAVAKARLRALQPDGDFSLWKANARGVDLNVNFDARWGMGESNVRFPGPANYVGLFAGSEPEVKALTDFTLDVRPATTLSYHTKGEVIYHEFGQSPEDLKRDTKLAKELSRTTGYPLMDAGVSVGGYKDFCISKLHIPAFTVEAGEEKRPHPLGKQDLPQIWTRNRDVVSKLLALCMQFGL